MRAIFLLLTSTAIGFLGCRKAEEAAPPPPPNPQQPDPVAKSNPPGNAPTADAGSLLREVGVYGGYENRYGRKPTDPVHIMFRSPGPSDADLAKLRPALLASSVPVNLNLNGCGSITDAGLANIKDIPTLRGLQLSETKVTGAGLHNIAGLTQLEQLVLSSDSLKDADLAHLSKLTQLRKLSVYSKGVTAAGYAHLAGLTNLEEIHVGGISNELGDESLQHMKDMTRLKELSIGRDKLTDVGMGYLKNFTELQQLRIDGPKITAAGVAGLAPLKKLQKLTVLAGPGFTGDALAALAGMGELRELDLIYTSALDKAGSVQLGKLTGLKKLRLGRVGAGGLEGIAAMKGLQSLDLNYSGVGDENLKSLAGHASLEMLDIQSGQVSDVGLKHLAGLPKLTNLSASGNNITDAGLASLATIPNLKSIGLSDCKITGSGFKDLAKHTTLKTLWVNGNPVTDEHVMALKEIRSLKEVTLTGTKVSDEVALALKQARPDVTIRDTAGDEVALNKKPTFEPKRPPVEDLTKVEPAFKLTAAAFHKEVKADNNAASQKYKGKVIELSGEVDSAGRNFSGSYVSLKIEGELLGVMCMTADEQPWGKAVHGQQIKLKGKWPEFAVVPALVDCVFVDTGKYAGISITAAELAKEYAADADATVKKYDKKILVLSGEVEAKEFNSAGAASVTLKTEGKVKVICSFTAFEKDITKPIKVGQKIKVVGEFTLNFGNSDKVEVYFCLPLTER